MTDAQYLFVSDSREKKSVARSAVHRKGGRKSKKCTLPSDYLTEKQRKELNGAVDSYSLNYFYTWAQFKALPDDIQVEWINHMSKKYDCGYTAIAKLVLNKPYTTFHYYLARKGILDQIVRRERGATKEARDGIARLRDDLAAERGEVIDASTAAGALGKPEEAPPITAARLELNRFDFDAFKILANMFNGKDVCVRIEVTEQWGKTNG